MIVLLFILGALVLLLALLPPLSIGLQLLIPASLGGALLLGRLILRKIATSKQAAEMMEDPVDPNDSLSCIHDEEDQADSRDALTVYSSEPCADCSHAQVLLITRNSAHRQAIVTSLKTWGHSCCVVESCVEAICHILNQIDQGSDSPVRLLIVDTQGLELEANSFASLLRNESRLAQIRLLCLNPLDHSKTAQQLLKGGYAGLINTPIEKSQLFAAIEGGVQPPHQADNVIDLSLRRQAHSRAGEIKTILLAEPNASERSRLQRQLDKAGHIVIGVENGEQALDALELQHVDIAVINLLLPIMNGTQVIKLHRFTTPHKHWVPFITLTDQNTPATLKLCHELQIKACLFKPIPVGELLKMIAATPSMSLTADTGSAHPSPSQAPYFLHADLLDRRILQCLEQLDSDQNFVADLIEIFIRESIIILQEMHLSIQSGQRNRFIEQCKIMQDNAGQLGAFALYEMCLTQMQIDQPTFETGALQRYALLEKLVSQTSQAFHDYLADMQAHQTDRS